MVKKRKKKLFEKKFIPKYAMKTGEFYDPNSEGTGKFSSTGFIILGI